jgi:F-type H+-transporting ATPase subunit delta
VAKDPQVAYNYAQALFNVVTKQDMPLDDAVQEAHGIRSIVLSSPRYRIFMEGPQIRKQIKEEVASRALTNNASNVFRNLVLMLIRHGRVEYLAEVMDAFVNLALEKQGVVPGTVTTAIPLADEEKQYLQERLEATQQKRFNLRFEVDPNLIGGVRVRYGDRLIDSSIATYLADLRQKLKATRLAS